MQTKIEKLFLESNYLQAIKLLMQLLKKDPNNVEYLSQLAFAYEQQAHVHSRGATKRKYFKLAEKTFDQIAKLGERAIALRGLGTIELHRGKFKEARALFSKSYALDPSDSKTLVALGNVARHLKKYDEALDWYEKYRKREGDSWQLFANEALTAREAGKMSIAKDRAQAALRRWPRTTNVHLQRMKKTLTKIM